MIFIANWKNFVSDCVSHRLQYMDCWMGLFAHKSIRPKCKLCDLSGTFGSVFLFPTCTKYVSYSELKQFRFFISSTDKEVTKRIWRCTVVSTTCLPLLLRLSTSCHESLQPSFGIPGKTGDPFAISHSWVLRATFYMLILFEFVCLFGCLVLVGGFPILHRERKLFKEQIYVTILEDFSREWGWAVPCPSSSQIQSWFLKTQFGFAC